MYSRKREESKIRINSRRRLESPAIAGDSPVCETESYSFYIVLEYFDTCLGRMNLAALNG